MTHIPVCGRGLLGVRIFPERSSARPAHATLLVVCIVSVHSISRKEFERVNCLLNGLGARTEASAGGGKGPICWANDERKINLADGP